MTVSRTVRAGETSCCSVRRGVGKSMLARRLTTLLPDLTLAEAIETTRIHSVAGLTDGRSARVTRRPFRAPHHTISEAGLIGGGHIPLPGEVPLVHNGVLFLDELPEYERHGLEVLRQPVERGHRDDCLCLDIGDIRGTVDPGGAMNTWPRGHSSHHERGCTCTPQNLKQ